MELFLILRQYVYRRAGKVVTVKQFEILLEKYSDSIFGFCCHLTGSIDSAEDLYQYAILKAFSMIKKSIVKIQMKIPINRQEIT